MQKILDASTAVSALGLAEAAKTIPTDTSTGIYEFNDQVNKEAV